MGSSAGMPVAAAGSEGRGMFAPKGTVGGREAGARGAAVAILAPPTDASVLGDPQKAFGYFRDRHAGRTALEDNKALLGQKYTRAKVSDDVFGHCGNTMQPWRGAVTSKTWVYGSATLNEDTPTPFFSILVFSGILGTQ